jgi:ketosteroid isomerase-like protein
MDVIARYGRAVTARDVDRAVSCFARDASLKVDGAPHVPFVGRFDGHDAIRSFLQLFFSLTEPDPAFVPDSVEVIERDGHIVLLSAFRHRVIDTGRFYSGDYALHCEIRDGLIHRYQIYENSWSVGQAFDQAAPSA